MGSGSIEGKADEPIARCKIGRQPEHKFLAAMESLCVNKAPSDEVDSMFEAAFTACAESKCRYFEALANERLARLYFDEEPEETKGVKYLKRAIDLYRSWGALAKAEWLENKERYRHSLNVKVCYDPQDASISNT